CICQDAARQWHRGVCPPERCTGAGGNPDGQHRQHEHGRSEWTAARAGRHYWAGLEQRGNDDHSWRAGHLWHDQHSPHDRRRWRPWRRGSGAVTPATLLKVPTVIAVTQLVKDYHLAANVVHALRAVDLEVHQGEFVAI